MSNISVKRMCGRAAWMNFAATAETSGLWPIKLNIGPMQHIKIAIGTKMMIF